MRFASWMPVGQSSGDHQVIADVPDADAPPCGVDDRIVLGPSADMSGEANGAVAGTDSDVAVVRQQAVSVERTFDQIGHVRGLHVAEDLDVVDDAPHAGQPGDGVFSRVPLESVAYYAGEPHITVIGAGLDVAWHSHGHRERVVGGSGQHRIVPVVGGRQLHHQV